MFDYLYGTNGVMFKTWKFVFVYLPALLVLTSFVYDLAISVLFAYVPFVMIPYGAIKMMRKGEKHARSKGRADSSVAMKEGNRVFYSQSSSFDWENVGTSLKTAMEIDRARGSASDVHNAWIDGRAWLRLASLLRPFSSTQAESPPVEPTVSHIRDAWIDRDAYRIVKLYVGVESEIELTLRTRGGT